MGWEGMPVSRETFAMVSLQATRSDEGDNSTGALLQGQRVSIVPFRDLWMKEEVASYWTVVSLHTLAGWNFLCAAANCNIFHWVKFRHSSGKDVAPSCCFCCFSIFMYIRFCVLKQVVIASNTVLCSSWQATSCKGSLGFWWSVCVFWRWPLLFAVLFVMVVSECNLTRKTQEVERNYILFSLWTNRNGL